MRLDATCIVINWPNWPAIVCMSVCHIWSRDWATRTLITTKYKSGKQIANRWGWPGVACPLWCVQLAEFIQIFSWISCEAACRGATPGCSSPKTTKTNNWLNWIVCNAQIRLNCTGINGKWAISGRRLLQITTLTLPLLRSACCCRRRRPRFTSLLTSPMWIWWIFNISRISTRRIHAPRRKLIRYWNTFRKRKPYWIM